MGIDDAEWSTHDIKTELERQGIDKFHEDFAILTDKDIDTFENLLTKSKRSIKLILAFYQWTARQYKQAVKLEKIGAVVVKDQFNNFRVTAYDPNAPIVQWNVSNNAGLENWNRSIKPNKSEYKELRDDTNYLSWHESFMSTIQAQNLSHVIDPNYATTNSELDSSQQKWLFSVLESIIKTPTGKSILRDYQTSKNVRDFWKEFTAAMATNMSCELRVSSISSYVTSTRLADGTWKGKQEAYIGHMKEQFRQIAEMDPENKFTDQQQIRLMSQAVQGVPNLEQVLNTLKITNKTNIDPTTGQPKKITFADYVAVLTQYAQTHDAANIRTTNPRFRRSVNQHDIEFEYNEHQFEAEVHDIDTDVTVLMAYKSEANRRPNGPRRVLMSKETWVSLNLEDRKAWDTISDDGKRKILAYSESKTTNPQSSDSQAHIRSINEHEVIFDDEPPSTEANTHEILSNSHVTNSESAPATNVLPNKEIDLLDLATTKTSTIKSTVQPRSNAVSGGITVNSIMRHQPRNNKKVDAGNHEVFAYRSDFTPLEDTPHQVTTRSGPHLEFNIHEFDIDGYHDSDDEDELPALAEPEEDADDDDLGMPTLVPRELPTYYDSDEDDDKEEEDLINLSKDSTIPDFAVKKDVDIHQLRDHFANKKDVTVYEYEDDIFVTAPTAAALQFDINNYVDDDPEDLEFKAQYKRPTDEELLQMDRNKMSLDEIKRHGQLVNKHKGKYHTTKSYESSTNFGQTAKSFLYRKAKNASEIVTDTVFGKQVSFSANNTLVVQSDAGFATAPNQDSGYVSAELGTPTHSNTTFDSAGTPARQRDLKPAAVPASTLKKAPTAQQPQKSYASAAAPKQAVFSSSQPVETPVLLPTTDASNAIAQAVIPTSSPVATVPAIPFGTVFTSTDGKLYRILKNLQLQEVDPAENTSLISQLQQFQQENSTIDEIVPPETTVDAIVLSEYPTNTTDLSPFEATNASATGNVTHSFDPDVSEIAHQSECGSKDPSPKSSEGSESVDLGFCLNNHPSDDSWVPEDSLGTLPDDHSFRKVTHKKKRNKNKKKHPTPSSKGFCNLLSPGYQQASSSSDSGNSSPGSADSQRFTVPENPPNLPPANTSDFGEAGQH